ncbi:MAG: hypothetical protein J0I08_06725 [Rhizobiales bacterium]|nr:hypothetical protein [Hyphomicrobiales bacterium]
MAYFLRLTRGAAPILLNLDHVVSIAENEGRVWFTLSGGNEADGHTRLVVKESWDEIVAMIPDDIQGGHRLD